MTPFEYDGTTYYIDRSDNVHWHEKVTRLSDIRNSELRKAARAARATEREKE